MSLLLAAPSNATYKPHVSDNIPVQLKLKFLILFIVVAVHLGCSIQINQSFNYHQFISPSDVRSDLEDLKKNLHEKHFDIDWDGRELTILNAIDSIGMIQETISLDSLEKRLSPIINSLDDGHSRVIHQDSLKKNNRNAFAVAQITNSILYYRIGNFSDTEQINLSLSEFRKKYTATHNEVVILDVRHNPGGNIRNVHRVLSHFLPTKSKFYDRVETNQSSLLSTLTNKIVSKKFDLSQLKFTSKKMISGNPKIYVWIDDRIASGSMVLSYHLQKNNAIIVGQRPKGIFNTFGNAYGYKLPKSKIVYTLASMRVYLNPDAPSKQNDMLIPDFEPNKIWELDDLVRFINKNE